MFRHGAPNVKHDSFLSIIAIADRVVSAARDTARGIDRVRPQRVVARGVVTHRPTCVLPRRRSLPRVDSASQRRAARMRMVSIMNIVRQRRIGRTTVAEDQNLRSARVLSIDFAKKFSLTSARVRSDAARRAVSARRRGRSQLP